MQGNMPTTRPARAPGRASSVSSARRANFAYGGQPVCSSLLVRDQGREGSATDGGLVLRLLSHRGAPPAGRDCCEPLTYSLTPQSHSKSAYPPQIAWRKHFSAAGPPKSSSSLVSSWRAAFIQGGVSGVVWRPGLLPSIGRPLARDRLNRRMMPRRACRLASSLGAAWRPSDGRSSSGEVGEVSGRSAAHGVAVSLDFPH